MSESHGHVSVVPEQREWRVQCSAVQRSAVHGVCVCAWGMCVKTGTGIEGGGGGGGSVVQLCSGGGGGGTGGGGGGGAYQQRRLSHVVSLHAARAVAV